MRVVALLFLVHGALLAFSQGAAADAPRRDQFGNVLCLAGGEIGHDGAHARADHQSKTMECCSLGCGMFAGVSVEPPVPGAPIDAGAPARDPAFVSYRDALAGYERTSRSTRGPPADV